MMMMKREREVDSITMANYLVLLSRGSDQFETTNNNNYLMMVNSSSNGNNRVFECKTCNRQFSSFQALGGHRASHKKPRLMEGSEGEHLHGSPPKPKTHECSICGLEFAIGQALGGHMRRHRSAAAASASNGGNMHSSTTATTTTMMSSSSGGGSSVDNSANGKKDNDNNSKRSVLFLDLNLTPFENDLEILKIGQPTNNNSTPLVDCFN